MKKKSVKYLQGINFSQLTLVENTEIKNLGRATPDLVISQSLANKKFKPATYATRKWLSGFAERNALLSPAD